MLQIVDALAFLHSLDIIHHDLLARNILAAKPIDVEGHLGNNTPQANPVALCDLQCHHASLKLPKFQRDKAFTPASDIYCLGFVLWQLCYYNNPINILIMLDNPPPAPFNMIFNQCMQNSGQCFGN
jgi:serine/threonine protein kinase